MERSSSQAYSIHLARAVDGVLELLGSEAKAKLVAGAIYTLPRVVLELLGSEAKAKPYRDRRCFDEKGLSASLCLST